jgi:hypothetical protein
MVQLGPSSACIFFCAWTHSKLTRLLLLASVLRILLPSYASLLFRPLLSFLPLCLIALPATLLSLLVSQARLSGTGLDVSQAMRSAGSRGAHQALERFGVSFASLLSRSPLTTSVKLLASHRRRHHSGARQDGLQHVRSLFHLLRRCQHKRQPRISMKSQRVRKRSQNVVAHLSLSGAHRARAPVLTRHAHPDRPRHHHDPLLATTLPPC